MDYNTQENQDFIEEMINHLLGINGKNIREHFGEEHIEILKKRKCRSTSLLIYYLCYSQQSLKPFD